MPLLGPRERTADRQIQNAGFHPNAVDGQIVVAVNNYLGICVTSVGAEEIADVRVAEADVKIGGLGALSVSRTSKNFGRGEFAGLSFPEQVRLAVGHELHGFRIRQDSLHRILVIVVPFPSFEGKTDLVQAIDATNSRSFSLRRGKRRQQQCNHQHNNHANHNKQLSPFECFSVVADWLGFQAAH